MLSVIIPAKNEANYLSRCLESLSIAQNMWGEEIEVIVVDNGSLDSTKDIAISKGCKVVEEPKGNISKLRNLGGNISKGNILVFLDADCLVAPEWILFCLENFENEKIAAVGTKAVPDFKNATWVEKAWYKLAPGAKRPNFVDWLGTSNLFIRKEVFWEIGGFDEKLETAEDVNLCYRINKKKKLIYLEKRINTIHLRESKTLRELFKREYWRGQSSLKILLKNRNLKELPSIIVIAANIISLISMIVLIFLRSWFLTVNILILLIFPVILLLKKRVNTSSLKELVQCYLVALTYILARSFSLLYEIVFLLKKKRYLSQDRSENKAR